MDSGIRREPLRYAPVRAGATGRVPAELTRKKRHRLTRKRGTTPRPADHRRRQLPADRIREPAAPSAGGTAEATTRTGIDLAAGVPLSRS